MTSIEPWYYRFLDAIASAGMMLGILQFLVSLLMGIVETALTGNPEWLLAILGSFCILLTLIIISAPMLLMVDLARNLRLVRRILEHE